MQLLLTDSHSRLRQILLIALAVVLIYCGMLSASKAFVFVAACLFLVWIPILMERSGRGTDRLRIIVGILCAVAVIASSSAFQELFRIIDDRFSYAANVSQLTTGRTVLWKRYLHEFAHDPLLTLLGEGFTTVTLMGRASHNTVLQGIYQFGLLGFPLVLAWLFRMMKNVVDAVPNRGNRRKDALLLCVGVMLPWMSLDILFFDELFLLTAYAAFGIARIREGEADVVSPRQPSPVRGTRRS